jgi:hypothetical protein
LRPGKRPTGRENAAIIGRVVQYKDRIKLHPKNDDLALPRGFRSPEIHKFAV